MLPSKLYLSYKPQELAVCLQVYVSKRRFFLAPKVSGCLLLIHFFGSAGEGAAAAVKPSAAFCQALDNEDEFDEVDELAAGRSRSGEGEPMPHLSTEVWAPTTNKWFSLSATC